MDSSSSSSSSSSSPLWDVFLSFRGEDTRNSFTSHLYTALVQASIRTYKDDRELEKSQEISSGLFKAIQDSKASIVVLSNNYAHSAWCLDELVEILACKKTKGLVIFPIFYHVAPSDVRGQKGKFGEAIENHKKRTSADNIEEWRSALSEIANISGYHIEKDSNVNESDTIKQIVGAVTPLVPKALYLEKDHLVGIDSAVEEICEVLSMQSSDGVRSIGICGMGGIGKTTIAKAFYNQYCENFDSSCFVENVKGTVQGPMNPLTLLNQILAQLLRINDCAFDVEFGIIKLNQIFSSRKVLVVIDDFGESSDLERLIRNCNLFCPGSTIIVTTRDQHLLKRLDIYIHMVNKLGENESLELFCCHAFGTTIPPEHFRNLSKSFVEYVDGLPLALKVLGSSLKVRDVSFWKEKLEKVKKIPESKIHEILKLSYDELSDRTEKDIFLYIVFFFVGKKKEEAVWVFESCDFFPHNGIPILLERCLLTVDKDDKIRMHNLIQDMGWKVIDQESHEPGKGKRFVSCENAFELFQKQEGTDKIEGLFLDLTWWTENNLSTNIFEMMPKLRLLEIANAPSDFKISFENSFHELRCIRWHYCPLTYLPSSFRSPKLTVLDMQFSNLKILWKGSQPSLNLKSINLSWSKHLETITNFNKLKMYEKLPLRYCRNLLKLHKSSLHLDLGECQNLKGLPRTIGQVDGLRSLDWGGSHISKGLSDSIKQLTGLSELHLRGCYSLTQLPEIVGGMKGLKVLDASRTSIRQLPDSICELRHLNCLDLNKCTKLRYLPEQIGNMKGLTDIIAGESAIRQLPDSLVDLINLSCLKLNDCSNLERLPEQLGKMQCLELLDASNNMAMEELPNSIAQLSRLQRLYTRGCKKVGEIPGGIWNLTSLTTLHVEHSQRFQSLPHSIKHMKRLDAISLTCNIRSCLPLILCLTSLTDLSLIDTDDGESFFSSKPISLSNLSKLKKLRLENLRNPGSCLPELPLNLERLDIERCELLEQLPDLSTFIRLTVLKITGCNSLQSVPLLPPHLSTLHFNDCGSIRDTHDYLTTYKGLDFLDTIKCSNLIFNPDESFFEALECAEIRIDTAITKIPNWIGNKRSGRAVDCIVPKISSPNNSLRMILWIVYSCTAKWGRFTIEAVTTNKTDGTRRTYYVGDLCDSVGSMIAYVRTGGTYSFGETHKVSFQVAAKERDQQPYLKDSNRFVKLERCGIHFLYNR